MHLKSGNSFIISDIWEKSGFVLLCLTVFLMPFPRSWSLWTLGGFLFFGLVSWIAGFRNIKVLFLKKMYLVLLLVIYFLLYLLYFFIRDPRWEYVEDKLMFILIPLVGFSIFSSEFFKKKLKYFLISFILGILLICIYQFSRATWESISYTGGSFKFESLISPGISRFNWEQLSTFEHPTYLAIKTLWAFTIVFLMNDTLKIKTAFQVILIILFSVFLFFLSVRTSLLILAVLYISFIFYRFKTIVHKIVFILAIPVILYFVFSITKLNERLSFKLSEFDGKFKSGKIDWINLDTRARSWYSACNLIKEHPFFGVGLDARNILAEEYKRQGYYNEAAFRLNAHNQYLETQMTLGIPGTIVLIWMLLIPLIKRKKLWHPELIYPFILIISISMIFESILVRQWGIMFVVIFYCMLMIPYKDPLPQT